MNERLRDRLDDMLPAGAGSPTKAIASPFTSWISDHAQVIRGMGPTNRTAAYLSTSRTATGTCFECTFRNRLGTLYSLTVSTGAGWELAGRTAIAPDPTAALLAIGGLLEELGMLTSLR